MRRAGAVAAAAGRGQVPIDAEAAREFLRFVTREYTPPADKRTCVVLQCSVRRPFSKSPSHGSMRRAVYAATGAWPRKEFELCPVHVVVLASTLGPVPYELEDVYPANVRGGGVKHFSDEHYARVEPVLARRMAAYLVAHRDSYDHVATFTHGRYGDAMAAARRIAGLEVPIYPLPDGPRVVDLDGSRPRTYWQELWIQLTLQLVAWQGPAQQAAALRRLREMKVRYEL